MKMVKFVSRYEIRIAHGSEYSRPINYTQRLRDRKRALKLVKRLNKRYGLNSFSAPIKVAKKAP